MYELEQRQPTAPAAQEGPQEAPDLTTLLGIVQAAQDDGGDGYGDYNPPAPEQPIPPDLRAKPTQAALPVPRVRDRGLDYSYEIAQIEPIIKGLVRFGKCLDRYDNPDKGTSYATPELDRLWDNQGNWIGLFSRGTTAYHLERFIQEFLIDYSPRKAALRAGFCVDKPEAAVGVGGALRRTLAKQIRLRADNIALKCGVTAEKIMQELANIAFCNVGDFVNDDNYIKPLNTLSRQQTAAIKEIKVKGLYAGKGDDKYQIGDEVSLKFHDKLTAVELLGRHTKTLDIGKGKDDEDTGPAGGSQVNIMLYCDKVPTDAIMGPNSGQPHLAPPEPRGEIVADYSVDPADYSGGPA